MTEPLAGGIQHFAMPAKRTFIVIMAMLMAINAISIDIMLPGLQQMGASLGVEDENSRQWVITAYLVGMGSAQLVFGPLSDRFGRKGPLLCGLLIYIVSSLAITAVPVFSGLLALRFIQGIGAAATRVVTVSIIRDTNHGRQMAQVMSLVMMIFMIVPVVAPSIGQVILLISEWHMIFLFIGVYAMLVGTVVIFKLPETLPVSARRPLSAASVIQAFKTVLSNRLAFCYGIAGAFVFGALFGFINSSQQILVGLYQLGDRFPLVFASFAIAMALSSFANSLLVRRWGMQYLAHGALIGFMLVGLAWTLVAVFGHVTFGLFVLFYGSAMLLFGLITANFNAMAMEPLGSIAGTASSVLGFMQTVGGSLLGALIGQAFDGSVVPLATSFLLISMAAVIFTLCARKGHLF